MFEKLKEVICQYTEVSPDEITPKSAFSADLGFDSYNFISMLGDLEDEFDLEIDEAKASKAKTVQELISYLEGLE